MTKIYGHSDDLLEFEGDLYGEVCYFDSSETDEEKAKLKRADEVDLKSRPAIKVRIVK